MISGATTVRPREVWHWEGGDKKDRMKELYYVLSRASVSLCRCSSSRYRTKCAANDPTKFRAEFS